MLKQAHFSALAATALSVVHPAPYSECLNQVTVPASVRVTADSDLHFGTFMVFGNGRRTVDPSGLVTDEAIVALEGSIPSPARFTVTYDRGNQNRHILDVEIDLYVYGSGSVRIDGLDARLGALQSDIPRAARLEPGRPVRISLPNCRTRTCSMSFSLGGTLDVTRSYGGAAISVPIPVYAELVSDERQRR